MSGIDAGAQDSFELVLDAEGARAAAARGSFIIASAQVARIVIMFGSQLVLARLLVPSDFGLVAMVSPLMGFVAILNSMGLAESLVQARSIDQRRVSAVFWGTLALSLALAGAICCAAPLVSFIYGNARLTLLVFASALSLPIATLGSVPSALLRRRLEFRLLQSVGLVTTMLGVGITIALAYDGLGYWSITTGGLAASLAFALAVWARSSWRPSRPRELRAAFADISFGLNLTGANLATLITVTADNMIIGALLGSTAMGYYDRSYRLVVQPIGQLLAPVGGVAVALLSRLQDTAGEYRESYLQLVRTGFLLTLPVMLFSILYGDRLVEVLLGDRWSAAVPAFRWIAVGGLASALNASLSWLFISQRRMAAMRTAFVATTVISIASFLLGTRWGVVGVAAAGAIGFLLLSVPIVLWQATRVGPVTARALLAVLLPYGAACCATLAVGHFARPHIAVFGGFDVVAGGVLAFFTFVITLGLFPTERVEGLRAARFVLHKMRLNRFWTPTRAGVL